MNSTTGVTDPTKMTASPGFAKFGRVALVLVAGTMALMTVGGVFAYLTDSVTLVGASVQSNGLAEEPIVEGVDLRVKYGNCTSGESIESPAFSDDPVITFDPAQAVFDFAALEATLGGDSVVDIPPRLCLANAGEVGGSVDLSVLSYESTEVGDCSAAEAEAENMLGFAGCTEAAAGELALVTDLVIREYCAGGDVGPYDSGSWDLWMIGNVAAMGDSGVPHSIAQLAPGESCTIDLELLTRFDSVDDPMRASQTDTLAITMALDLVQG